MILTKYEDWTKNKQTNSSNEELFNILKFIL